MNQLRGELFQKQPDFLLNDSYGLLINKCGLQEMIFPHGFFSLYL